MTLKEYMNLKGLTLEKFAVQIERSPATVSRIVRGLHRPDWKTMDQIAVATKNKVLPNDFQGV